ncbi:hypothetical protein SNEBB_001253 [Seison nebaliae]|nr:hypothetical protein SNEBB_001253 [Seison nebaliae]
MLTIGQSSVFSPEIDEEHEVKTKNLSNLVADLKGEIEENSVHHNLTFNSSQTSILDINDVLSNELERQTVLDRLAALPQIREPKLLGNELQKQLEILKESEYNDISILYILYEFYLVRPTMILYQIYLMKLRKYFYSTKSNGQINSFIDNYCKYLQSQQLGMLEKFNKYNSLKSSFLKMAGKQISPTVLWAKGQHLLDLSDVKDLLEEKIPYYSSYRLWSKFESIAQTIFYLHRNDFLTISLQLKNDRLSFNKYRVPLLKKESMNIDESIVKFLQHFNLSFNTTRLREERKEMELYGLVIRHFRQLFQKQERYMSIISSGQLLRNSKHLESSSFHTTVSYEYEKMCQFLHLHPTYPSDYINSQNHTKCDILLKNQAKIIHLKSPDLLRQMYNSLANSIQTIQLNNEKMTNASSINNIINSYEVLERMFNSNAMELHQTKKDNLEVEPKSLGMSAVDRNNGKNIDFNRLQKTEKKSQSSTSTGDYAYMETLQKLGLDDPSDSSNNNNSNDHGILMSFLLLRHLRMRDDYLQTFYILNYFRSIQRTLIIIGDDLIVDENNDICSEHFGTFSTDIGLLSPNIPDISCVNPSPMKLLNMNNLKNMDVHFHFDRLMEDESHDYTGIMDENNNEIIYEETLKDIKKLEFDLIQIASHSIECGQPASLDSSEDSANTLLLFNSSIDRYAIIYDIWKYQALYLNKMKELVEIYWTIYLHTDELNMQQELSCVINDLMFGSYRLPRFDHHSKRTKKSPIEVENFVNYSSIITNDSLENDENTKETTKSQKGNFNSIPYYFVDTYVKELTILDNKISLLTKIFNEIVLKMSNLRELNQQQTTKVMSEPRKPFTNQLLTTFIDQRCSIIHLHPTLGYMANFERIYRHHLHILVREDVWSDGSNLSKLILEQLYSKLLNEEFLSTDNDLQLQFSSHLSKEVLCELKLENVRWLSNLLDESIYGELKEKEDDEVMDEQRKNNLLIATKLTKGERAKKLSTLTVHLLELLNLRIRLLQSCQLNLLLLKSYKRYGEQLQFTNYHAYLRHMKFEYGKFNNDVLIPNQIFLEADKPEIDSDDIDSVPSTANQNIFSLTDPTANDSQERRRNNTTSQTTSKTNNNCRELDRFLPNTFNLAISELDEGSISWIDYRHRNKILEMLTSDLGMEFHRLVNRLEITQSFFLLTALQIMEVCSKTHPNRELQSNSFISIQYEKTQIRDGMLNDFVEEKNKSPQIISDKEQLKKVKIEYIENYLGTLALRLTELSARYQLIYFYDSILEILSEYNTTKYSHFMIGDEFDLQSETKRLREKRTEQEIQKQLKQNGGKDFVSIDITFDLEEEKKLDMSDTKNFVANKTVEKRMPKKFFVSDITQEIAQSTIANLWYIPHYTELLVLFRPILPPTIDSKSSNFKYLKFLKEQHLWNEQIFRNYLLLILCVHDLLKMHQARHELDELMCNRQINPMKFHVQSDQKSERNIYSLRSLVDELQQETNRLEKRDDLTQVSNLVQIKRREKILETVTLQLVWIPQRLMESLEEKDLKLNDSFNSLVKLTKNVLSSKLLHFAFRTNSTLQIYGREPTFIQLTSPSFSTVRHSKIFTQSLFTLPISGNDEHLSPFIRLLNDEPNKDMLSMGSGSKRTKSGKTQQVKLEHFQNFPYQRNWELSPLSFKSNDLHSQLDHIINGPLLSLDNFQLQKYNEHLLMIQSISDDLIKQEEEMTINIAKSPNRVSTAKSSDRTSTVKSVEKCSRLNHRLIDVGSSLFKLDTQLPLNILELYECKSDYYLFMNIYQRLRRFWYIIQKRRPINSFWTDINLVKQKKELSYLRDIRRSFDNEIILPSLKLLIRQINQKFTSINQSVMEDNLQLMTIPYVTDLLKQKSYMREMLKRIDLIMIDYTVKDLQSTLQLILNERNNEQATCPVDLWHNSSLDEIYSINYPTTVQMFVNHLQEDETIEMNEKMKNHLSYLSRLIMKHEREMFTNYTLFYESLLNEEKVSLHRLSTKLSQEKCHSMEVEKNFQCLVEFRLAYLAKDLITELAISKHQTKRSGTAASSDTNEQDIELKLRKEYGGTINDLVRTNGQLRFEIDQMRERTHNCLMEVVGQAKSEAIVQIEGLRDKLLAGTQENYIKDRLTSYEKQSENNYLKLQNERNEQKDNIRLLIYFYRWRMNVIRLEYDKNLKSCIKQCEEVKQQSLHRELVAHEDLVLYRYQQTILQKKLRDVCEKERLLQQQLQMYESETIRQNHINLQAKKTTECFHNLKENNIEVLKNALNNKEQEINELAREKLEKDNELKLKLQKTQQQLTSERRQKMKEKIMKNEAFQKVHELKQHMEQEKLQKTYEQIKNQTTSVISNGTKKMSMERNRSSLSDKTLLLSARDVLKQNFNKNIENTEEISGPLRQTTSMTDHMTDYTNSRTTIYQIPVKQSAYRYPKSAKPSLSDYHGDDMRNKSIIKHVARHRIKYEKTVGTLGKKGRSSVSSNQEYLIRLSNELLHYNKDANHNTSNDDNDMNKHQKEDVESINQIETFYTKLSKKLHNKSLT